MIIYAIFRSGTPFVDHEFDAKGNYNFDPLCQQKMSAAARTQSWVRVETCRNFRWPTTDG